LIGGSLFVNLVPNVGKGAELVQSGIYPELPTSDNEYNQIARQLAAIVERVHSLPIEDIGKDLQASLKSLRSVATDLQSGDVANKTAALMNNLKKATDGLDSTFEQLDQTLRSIDQTMAPDSALSHALNETLDDISDASKSMEQLTDELYRYPDALLRGKGDDKQ
jgi:paraquat-inducible protein B